MTTEAYGRWLRAQRPPLDMFAALSVEEQETLAQIGEEYIQSIIIALGYAATDPEAAEAGLDAEENENSEGVLLQKVIAGAVQQILGDREAAPQQPAQAPPTYAGIGARKRQAAQTRMAQECADVASTATFLGRPPDEVVPKESFQP